jgi:hypothetical protein
VLSVFWLRRLEVKPATTEWTLHEESLCGGHPIEQALNGIISFMI